MHSLASSHSQSHSAIAKTVGPRPVVLTPGARVFVSRSSGFPSENSSNRMLEQWEEHQPPIRSNTCFGVAVSARSGVQLARLGREVLSRKGFDANSLRRVGPFLKEFVKRKRFSSGRLRNASAERGSHPFRVCWSRSMPRSSRCLGFGLRLGCRRYGKLRSFFADAIAPNSFLRKVPLTRTVSSSAR